MTIDNLKSPDRATPGLSRAEGTAPDGASRPAPGTTDLLSLDDLHISVHHGAATAIRGVSLGIRPGEIVGLVGESGSGKTLTCRAALGVLPAGVTIDHGSMTFAGHDLTALSRRGWEDVHGNHMGAVFQDPASYLNPSITVGQQITEVLRVKLGLPRRAARRRAADLCAAVGLRDPERVLDQIPVELSGGMLQRVMIAIAISCEPRLLVADEPTTALDVTIQAEVLELLQRLRDERGLAVLFVSHDLAVVTQLCDRIAVFYAGEIVESGPAREIAERPRHPYTQALLRVASVGDFGRRELEVIPGQPPQVGADIAGCRFAARCPVAQAACRDGAVAPVLVGDRHQVRCVRAGGRVGELVAR